MIYPNPAKNTINVKNASNLKVTAIQIMDITSKKIEFVPVSSSNNQAIDISTLSVGMLIINKYNNDEKIAQNKITVE
jgi:hypothetical protein